MNVRSKIEYYVGIENETTRRIYDPSTGLVTRHWTSIADDGYDDSQDPLLDGQEQGPIEDELDDAAPALQEQNPVL
jgi:hypothetical protein